MIGAPEQQVTDAHEWLQALNARVRDQASALARIEERLGFLASSATTTPRAPYARLSHAALWRSDESTPAPAQPREVLPGTDVTLRADSQDGPPRITVIVSTHNQERYVADAIESVFAQQTGFQIQLIVTDDASTDSTPEIIETFRRQRPEVVTVLRSARNSWYFANVLRALALTKTDYFTLLDADDYWTDETYLQRGVDFLENHPDFVIYSANCFCEHFDGSRMLFIREDIPDREFGFADYLQHQAVLMQTTGTIFRNVYFKSGVPRVFTDMLTNDEQYSFACDFDRSAIHLEKGKARFENRTVGVYRITGDGIYSRLTPVDKALWEARRKLDHWKFFSYRHPEFFLSATLSWLDSCLESMRHVASGIYADMDITPQQVADVRQVMEECRSHITSLAEARSTQPAD